MKKILLTLLFISICTATFAQSNNNVTFGIRGGVNSATLSSAILTAEYPVATSAITSFSAGAFIDFRICESFSLQSALIYTGKGSEEKGGSSSINIYYNGEMNIKYLQIPVHGLYHVPAGSGDFYIGAGPFAAYGLSGSRKISITEDGFKEPAFSGGYEKRDMFNNNDGFNYKRWDYGVSALAGFKHSSGFLLNINYDLGLNNLRPGEANSSLKTRVLGLSVGYAF